MEEMGLISADMIPDAYRKPLLTKDLIRRQFVQRGADGQWKAPPGRT